MTANAGQAVAIDYLQGEGNVKGLRLGYRPVETQLITLPWVGDVDIYWEASLNLWEFGDPARHESNLVLALSPVISKQFATLAGTYPLYWEAGIGVSLVNDTRFAGKDIGSHYQFEDRLGVRLEFSRQHTIAVRYLHYSNGGLNSKNPGMDFFNLAYVHRF
ncbi:acyloxyacyl hydrolase [Aestuariibacter halophilus]|uniref:Acyloxyacyl hydrolase n=1 Tax=Fluctibacter halophilus TaxID=226011 RepID=A0ABS8GA01_9ALTE|nr:acyloxyacyl hydrolase [Aestuariibacter halophilus]MCC2616635.1 acyloxyacyl hydrolase [Aestuariibacter halophilus]